MIIIIIRLEKWNIVADTCLVIYCLLSAFHDGVVEEVTNSLQGQNIQYRTYVLAQAAGLGGGVGQPKLYPYSSAVANAIKGAAALRYLKVPESQCPS